MIVPFYMFDLPEHVTLDDVQKYIENHHEPGAFSLGTAVWTDGSITRLFNPPTNMDDVEACQYIRNVLDKLESRSSDYA